MFVVERRVVKMKWTESNLDFTCLVDLTIQLITLGMELCGYLAILHLKRPVLPDGHGNLSRKPLAWSQAHTLYHVVCGAAHSCFSAKRKCDAFLLLSSVHFLAAPPLQKVKQT